MKRHLGSSRVNPIGLGCMSLSHAYGPPAPRDVAVRLLNQALDLGYDHLDTASLYGFGANESLLAEAIGHRRDEYVLASKCGMTGVAGKRTIDGRPETLLATIDESLRRLNTDRVDLYYLHRLDPAVPVEESVGALARMVEAGKVRAIGLSEVSAATLRKAHAVHPIAAVQNEFSLWSRNVELGVIEATRELGVALVAFSPVGRGFLAGSVRSVADLAEGDLRRTMPRFQPDTLQANLGLLDLLQRTGAELGLTSAQIALRWLLDRGDHVLPIPGTTSPAHLAENFATPPERLPAAVTAMLDAEFERDRIAGHRYSPATLTEIDTEDY